MEKSETYNKIKKRVNIVGYILNGGIITLLAFSNLSRQIAKQTFASNDYIWFLKFIIAITVIFSLLEFPMNFYSEYILEKRFNLSNQTLVSWAWEKLKSLFLAAVIGIPIALIFYLFIKTTNEQWWIYFSIFLIFFSVILSKLAPIIIFPLFYKFTEITEGEIYDKIIALTKGHDISIKGIYSFNMSKDTKKANAAFTGLGKSKRIILSDTLIEKFSPEEIAVVFAHELGHYHHKHILKNLFIGSGSIVVAFFLCNIFYIKSLTYFNYNEVWEIAALPLLLFYITLFNLLTMPITNIISRFFERQADKYAVDLTHNKEAFISSMEKLSEQNLADENPGRTYEFLFYSHPSIPKRIDFAKNYKGLKK